MELISYDTTANTATLSDGSVNEIILYRNSDKEECKPEDATVFGFMFTAPDGSEKYCALSIEHIELPERLPI